MLILMDLKTDWRLLGRLLLGGGHDGTSRNPSSSTSSRRINVDVDATGIDVSG